MFSAPHIRPDLPGYSTCTSIATIGRFRVVGWREERGRIEDETSHRFKWRQIVATPGESAALDPDTPAWPRSIL